MDAMTTEDLVLAQGELFRHSLGCVKSMALKCAVDLGIPNAIHHHGGSATLSDIIAAVGLPVSRKPYVHRLMNLLTISGVFTASDAAASGGEAEAVVYHLAPTSRLLVDCNKPGRSLAPLIHFTVNTVTVLTFSDLHAWLKDEKAATTKSTLFEMAHGCSCYEMARKNDDYNALYNNAMAAASQITMEVILRGAVRDVFRGLSSLIDVGGGHGAASVAIAGAFPHIKYRVLDLPHVVSQAQAHADGTVQFIAGDMFECIPKADAVLLKWVLHCWGDDDCVKVLQKCKEAIPARGCGGKLIIIDTVMGAGPHDSAYREAQALYDFHMMHVDGVERDERGWEKIIREAGFAGHKIVSVVGIHSVIEVYP